jgi:hypothetical protein
MNNDQASAVTPEGDDNRPSDEYVVTSDMLSADRGSELQTDARQRRADGGHKDEEKLGLTARFGRNVRGPVWLTWRQAIERSEGQI